MRDALTEKQAGVLDFIATHIVERQRPPTRKEIAKRFGWSSTNAAEDCLQRIEARGHIVMEGAEGGGLHRQRYVRIVRWPSSVLPLIRWDKG